MGVVEVMGLDCRGGDLGAAGCNWGLGSGHQIADVCCSGEEVFGDEMSGGEIL